MLESEYGHRNETFCHSAGGPTDQQLTGSGNLSLSDPIFMLTQLGRNKCSPNRQQTLVSLAAAKSSPWCRQHALTDAVFSCDVAVSARYTFSHTPTHTHTDRKDARVASVTVFVKHGPFPHLALLMLLAAHMYVCCRLISQWSRNCCHLSCRLWCVCVYEFGVCVCVSSAFFPCWSSAFFRWQLFNEIISNNENNSNNCCCC